MAADGNSAKGGRMRSATLLLAIGEERAAKVLKHLDVREVRTLSQTMAEMNSVPRSAVHDALQQFHDEMKSGAVAGSPSYLRNVLTEALGKRQGEAMLARIIPSESGALDNAGPGLSNLRWMDARSISELMRNEHPQVVSMVLSLLDSDQAAEVVELLPEPLALEALQRVATIGRVQPGALRELSEALNEQFTADQDSMNLDSFGGVESAAEMLNRVDATRTEKILDELKEEQPDLAEKIEDLMFVFADLVELEDRGLQLLLREVESGTLLLAIKGANEELRDKIFRNMSQRAAEILKDDLEARGPVRVSEVESAQKEVLRIARNLAEQGQIILSSGGAEEMI